MIDLKYLQKNFDEASTRFIKKGVELETLKTLKELFSRLKEKNFILEEAQAEQNKMSKLFGEYMREKKDVTELKEKVDTKKEEIVGLQELAREAQEALEKVVLAMPNLPDDSVSEGVDEDDNVKLRKIL